MKAAESVGIEFLGIAGTSAGAIVAAFAAAGYEADEIFDPVNPNDHVLRAHGAPVKFFDNSAWRTVTWLRRTLASKNGARFRPLVVWAAATCLAAWWNVRKRTGLLDSHKLTVALNDLLLAKINANLKAKGRPPLDDDLVKFRHLSRLMPGCTPLKIIVTDLSRNRVVVFSVDDTPDVVVAHAVAASAAVPLLFKPAAVPWSEGHRGDVYVDGGLSSNLPVWVFSEEKRADARRFGGALPVIGFGFQEREAPSPLQPVRLSLAELVGRMAAASLSTGQSVTRDFVDDLVMIPLPCHLSLLDIDADAKSVARACSEARDYASERLGYIFARRPRAIQTALRAFHTEAIRLLREQGQPEGTHVRVSAIEPVESRYGHAGPLNFRVTECWGFDDDADDRLTLDASNRGAPRAFRERQATLWDSLGLKAKPASDHFMTKYERALVRPTLSSAVSIPVFADEENWRRDATERDRPLGVVAVDSDSDLREYFENPGVLGELTRKTLLLVDVFKE